MPWQHFIIDDFCTDVNAFRNAVTDVSSYYCDSNDEAKVHYALLKERNLLSLFVGNTIPDLVFHYFGKKCTLNKKSFVQLRRMSPLEPEFPRHVDSFEGEPSFVALLYISPEWRKGCGGELCLFESDDPNERPAAMIEPVQGRLVLMETKSTHWHSVNKVKDWDRYSIVTEWMMLT